MSTPTFLDLLRSEVARMQSLYPEREGELARAHALILHGLVLPSAADPAIGQVLSSDAQTVYHVNGTCDCPAGEHGKGCKHVQAWKLYQYIAGKVAQAATSAPRESTAVESPRLPEAPVSITLKASVYGFETLVTLRGTDFASVQAQVEHAAQWLKAQAPTPSQGQEGWCRLHSVQMKWNAGKNGGKGWYSHRTDQSWCKGKS